jgi:plexin A
MLVLILPEWRTGTSGRLILYDEDSTTKTEGEWRKRNTLNHYRVSILNTVSLKSGFLKLMETITFSKHYTKFCSLPKFRSDFSAC